MLEKRCPRLKMPQHLLRAILSCQKSLDTYAWTYLRSIDTSCDCSREKVRVANAYVVWQTDFDFPAWRILIRSTWKEFQTRFRGILANLEKARWVFEECDNGITYQMYIRKRLESEQTYQNLTMEEHEMKMKMVQTWLAGNGYLEDDHQHYQDTRNNYPGTASWILDHPNLKDWLSFDDKASTPIMWMTGVPGAGE